MKNPKQTDSPFEALLDPNIRGAAYERVLQLLEQRITAVAKKRVPADAVQDVVQDTLIALVGKLPSLSSETDVLPYTCLILRNIIGNYYQRKKFLERFRGLDDCDIATNPLAGVETSIYLDQVLETCKRTNGEYSRIVQMVLNGHTPKEIAKALDLPSVQALRMKVHRGRKQLKAALREEEEKEAV